jgi:hypothetical protein
MENSLIIALVAAGTSILTLILSLAFKPFIDKISKAYQLHIEYQYEQRKKIKDTISKYKIHVVNAFDNLCGRLNNLANNHTMQWHYVSGEFKNTGSEYFQTTIYRVLYLFSWIKIIEDKLVFLDTTIADKEDLYFLKYLKATKRVIQRQMLTYNLQSQDESRKDVVFRDNLDEMCLWMIKGEEVMAFPEFRENIEQKLPHFKVLCQFIDGINPEENRRRWDRLYCIQILGLSFLNSFGYDFQKTSKEKMVSRFTKHKKHDIYDNLIQHVHKYELHEEPEMKKSIEILTQFIKTKNLNENR